MATIISWVGGVLLTLIAILIGWSIYVLVREEEYRRKKRNETVDRIVKYNRIARWNSIDDSDLLEQIREHLEEERGDNQ